MQYDKYELKIQKIEKFFKLIFKHLGKIITSASLMAAIVVTLLATRGIVTAEAELQPIEIVYGEELNYEAKAFLSDVEYEYSVRGLDDWSKDFPKEPGHYQVRAVAKATIGYRYSEIQDFIIEKKPVNVVISSEYVPYGSEPEVVAELVNNDHISDVSFAYTYDKNNVWAEIDSVEISDENGNVITSRYEIITEGRNITAIERKITIAIESASKVYDGTPLQNNKYSIVDGSLADGDILDVTFSSSITSVGRERNVADYKMFNADGDDVTGCYAITEVTGYLSVTKRQVELKTADMSAVYDNTAHSKAEYVVTGEYDIVDGHTLNIDEAAWANIKNAGTCSNSFDSWTIKDETNTDVSSNYEIVSEWGTLEVTKRPVVLKTADDEKVYDGTPLSNTTLTPIGEYSLVDGHSFAVSTNAAITDAGDTQNIVSAMVKDGEIDVTDNYDISYEFGTLKIIKRNITITSADGSWTYDGGEHYANDVPTDIEDLISGHSVIFVDFTRVVNFGEYDNEVVAKIFDGDRDVTDNYNISYDCGTLIISKFSVNVATGGIEVTYNGKAHSCDTYESPVLDDKGYTIEVIESSSITDFGSVTNEFFSYIVRDAQGNDVTANFDINFTHYGTITVTKRVISVWTGSAEKVYDGTPLTSSEWEITGERIEGHEIVANAPCGSQTDVGTSDNIYEGEISIWCDGVDVTDNYEIIPNIGTLTVLKREILVSSGSAEKVYDGTPLTSSEWEVIVNDEYIWDLLDDHEIVANAPCGSQTYVGTSDNIYEGEISIWCNGVDVTDNYEVVPTSGTLTVTLRPLSIQTGSESWEYDGDAHTNTEIDIVGGTTLGVDHTYQVDESTKVYITNFGDAENTVKIVILDGDGVDVTANYEISYLPGTLEITKKDITITSDGGNWTYDGDEHYANGTTTDCEEFLAGLGHSVIVTEYESFVNVGEYENKIVAKIFHGDIDVTNNYNISYGYGSLIINKRAINVETEDQNWGYDGEAHYWHGYKAHNIVDGHYIEVLESSSITDVGSTSNKFKSYVIYAIIDGERIDVTDNYAVTFVLEGTITVTKRSISVWTHDLEAVYNGEAHFSHGYDVYNIVDGHYIEVIESSSIINPGTIPNEFISYAIYYETIDGERIYVLKDNYNITFIEGTLRVAEGEISIVTGSAEKVYDGTPLTAPYWEIVDEDVEGLEIVAPGSYESLTDAYTITNWYYGDLREIRIYRDGVDVTEYYKINYDYGTLTVTQRPIIIGTNGYIGVYDGKDHTDVTLIDKTEGVEDSGLCEGHVFGNVVSKRELKDAFEGENVVYFDIMCDGVDVSTNYKITYEYGVVSITKRNITVATNGYNAVYDGKDHTDATLIDKTEGVEDSGLCEDHYFGNISAPIFNWVIGTKNNVYFEILSDGVDVSSNYEIKYEYGAVSITRRNITVATNGYNAVYDGKDHTDATLIDKTEGVKDSGLCEDHYFGNISAPTFNWVIETENDVYFDIICGDEIVTSNYEIKYEYGAVSITRRNITVATNGYNAVYDGKDHTDVTLIDKTEGVEDSGLCEGHVFGNVVSERELKDVFEGKNVVYFDIICGDEIVSSNYKITYEYGVVSITQRKITVGTNGYIGVYDGKDHTDVTLIDKTEGVEDSGLCEDHVFGNVASERELKDVFEGENVVYFDIMCDGVDVSSNYEIKYEYGAVSITKRNITVATNGYNAVYDGKDHTDATLIDKTEGVKDSGLCEDHYFGNISARVFNWVTEDENDVSFDIMCDGVDVSSNYEITYEYGVVSITKRKITVATNEYIAVYDGKDHTDATLIDKTEGVEDSGLCEDHYFGNISAPTFNWVIETENDVYFDIMCDDEIVTSNYEITYEYGVVSITKRNITVATNGYNAVYDGKDHTDVTLIDKTEGVEDSGLCEDHVFGNVASERELKDVFEGENVVYFDIMCDGVDVSSNYKITYEYGAVSITKRPLYIQTGSESWIEDGEWHTNKDFDIIDGKLEYHTYDVKESSLTYIREVGSTENYLELVIFDELNQDCSSNYDPQIVSYGTLEIFPKKVISIYLFQNEYEYNGEEHSLTADDYIVVDIPDGLEFELTWIGVSMTDAGSITSEKINQNISKYIKFSVYADGSDVDISNQILLVVVDYGVDDATQSYDVITVKPKKIEITTNSAEKVYDGTPLRNDGFQVTIGPLVEGHTISLEITGERSSIGWDWNYVNKESFRVFDGKIDVTHNYDPTFKLGTLTVTTVQ